MTDEPQLRPTQVVAQRVRDLRQRHGWSADRLAQEMRAVGVPWERMVVSKLENNRRAAVSVEELLALAYVLDVAPIHLLVPIDNDATRYAYTPERTSLPGLIREWIRGRLPMKGQDKRIYFAEVPDGEWKVEVDLSKRLSENGRTYVTPELDDDGKA